MVHEWNGDLEIFSRPQVMEGSGHILLLRTDILRKQSSSAPEICIAIQLVCGYLTSNVKLKTDIKLKWDSKS